MGLTVTKQEMLSALDQCGCGYIYPVYCNILDKGSFLSTNLNIHYGFLAITDRNELFVVDYNLLKEKTVSCYPAASFKSIKISKVPLLGSYNVTVDILPAFPGDKRRIYKYTIGSKILGSDFDEQGQNLQGIINVLKSWS